MPSSQNVRFTFSSTADIAFEVVSFELSEGISELFCLNVELISESANADFATLLDKPATLTLFQGDQPVRYVHGLIS
ncbi:contractile injection system protein, VgrG/Pvc8 family, partial [Pseudomonas helleri]